MADQELSIVKSEPLPELTIADKPEAPASAVSRFGSAALGALTSPVHFAQALVTDPKGLYESLVNQSAEHFEKASQLWQDQQYGPAIHRAIAGVIPPYGVVPEAADKIRAGDVAGGVGEAVGSGLTPKVLSAIPAVARGTVRAGGAVASAARAVSPEIAAKVAKHGSTAAGATLGTVVGGPVGGATGAIVGAGIGEDLATRIKARLTAKPAGGPTAAGYDRYMPNVSAPLADQLNIVLEETRPPAASAPIAAAPTIPLGKAMAEVREAAPAAKVKLTAPEMQAAIRLRHQGKPTTDIMDAIQALRELKSSPSMAELPTNTEMRADMAQRAVGGQKSLMGEYGPKPKGKSPQQLLNEEAIARRRETAATSGNPFR